MTHEFTIKRSEWYRGRGSKNSRLLRKEDQQKCCLGFYMLSLGFEHNEIDGVPLPKETRSGREIPQWLKSEMDGAESVSCSNLVGLNDDVHENGETIPDSEREARIARAFAEHDIKVNFID